jgi:uncharacterized protein (TIGR02444 family)
MKLRVSSGGVRILDRFEPIMSKPDIWTFALLLYAQDGVQEDCLAAQDRFGLEINALIFALYRFHLGVGFDAHEVVSLCEKMTNTIVAPIRAARIALKTPPASVDASAAHSLREKVKAAELDGERLTLEALTRLPDGQPASNPMAALESVVAATKIDIDTERDALLKRLAIAAQNV